MHTKGISNSNATDAMMLRVRCRGLIKKLQQSWSLKRQGGDEGSRTLGLCHATAALSQLSYVPKTSVYDSKMMNAVN